MIMKKIIFTVLSLSFFTQPLLVKAEVASCAALSGQTVSVTTNMVLPAACTLRDTRFVFENVQNVSLDLNGSTLVSSKLVDAIRFTTTNPQRPTRNVSVKNGTIKGYGTALFVRRELSSADLQALRTDPQGYYPYIQQTATSNVSIENLNFVNPHGSAVYVWVGNSKVSLKKSRITAAQGPAIYLDTGSFGNIIANNVITESGFLDAQGNLKQGRGLREAIAIDGSYDNRIARNTIQANARGGVHLYSNCGEKVHSDPTYVPRIFDAQNNVIRNNLIQNNGAGGAVEFRAKRDVKETHWFGNVERPEFRSGTVAGQGENQRDCERDALSEIQAEGWQVTFQRTRVTG
jgi:hypothetical protein